VKTAGLNCKRGCDGGDGGGGDLRWVDDSREVVNVVHAQIGDGESAACHLSRAQLAFLGLHSHHHICFQPFDAWQTFGFLIEFLAARQTLEVWLLCKY